MACLPQRLRQRGQALLELALVMPFLALLLLGVFDIGRIFAEQEAVTNAAFQGARQYGAGCGASAAQTAVALELGRAIVSSPGPAVVISTPNPNPANVVVVTVNYRHDLMFGLFSRFGSGGQLAMSVAASMPNSPGICPTQPPAPPPPPAQTQTAVAGATATVHAGATATSVLATATAQTAATATTQAQATATSVAAATQTAQTQATLTAGPGATQTAQIQATQTAQSIGTATAQAIATLTAGPGATQTAIAGATATARANATATFQAGATATAVAAGCPLVVTFNSYKPSGNNKPVVARINVLDSLGRPVSGANVSVTVNGLGTLSGATDATGFRCFNFAGAASNATISWSVSPPGAPSPYSVCPSLSGGPSSIPSSPVLTCP